MRLFLRDTEGDPHPATGPTCPEVVGGLTVEIRALRMAENSPGIRVKRLTSHAFHMSIIGGAQAHGWTSTRRMTSPGLTAHR